MRRKIEYRLIAGFTVILLLHVLGAAITVVWAARLGAYLDRLYVQGLEPVAALSSIQVELVAGDAATKLYVVSADPLRRRRLEAELELRDWHISELLAKLRNMPLSPLTRQNLEAFENRYIQYRNVRNDLLAASEAQRHQEAEALLVGPVAAAYTAADEAINELVRLSVRRGELMYQDSKSEVRTLWILLAGGLVLALGLGCLIAYTVVRRTARASGELAQALERAAQSAAEAAAARDLAQQRLTALEQAYRSLAGAADGIAELVGGLTEMARRQAGQAAQQAAAVSQVASTMDELWHTADEIAGSTQAGLAAAEEGAAAVEEAISAIESNRRTVDHVAQDIVTLGRQSQAIGNIVDIITDLANKIHLLALNAAIEAESAGEHGRRFGAVAQQVKELARSARQATTEVKAVISRLQAAANAAVMATEQAAKEAHLSASLANQAGSIIQQMVAKMQAISAAAQQQQAASEQIASTMRGVEEIVRQTTLQSQDVAGMAAELAATAESMRQQCAGYIPTTPELPDLTEWVSPPPEQSRPALQQAPAFALPSRS